MLMLGAIFVFFVLTYVPGIIVKGVRLENKNIKDIFSIPSLTPALRSLPSMYWVFLFILDLIYTNIMYYTAYAINWASVWINPIIYVVSQKKYQVYKSI